MSSARHPPTGHQIEALTHGLPGLRSGHTRTSGERTVTVNAAVSPAMRDELMAACRAEGSSFNRVFARIMLAFTIALRNGKTPSQIIVAIDRAISVAGAPDLVRDDGPAADIDRAPGAASTDGTGDTRRAGHTCPELIEHTETRRA
jgi:hypothetical protein